MLAEIKRTLADFGVDFDVCSQREVAARERASSSSASDGSREQGHVFESDGAVWLRTTDFGDDKDRV